MINCEICNTPIYKPPNTKELYFHRIDDKWVALYRDNPTQSIDKALHGQYNIPEKETMKIYE